MNETKTEAVIYYCASYHVSGSVTGNEHVHRSKELRSGQIRNHREAGQRLRVPSSSIHLGLQ